MPITSMFLSSPHKEFRCRHLRANWNGQECLAPACLWFSTEKGLVERADSSQHTVIQAKGCCTTEPFSPGSICRVLPGSPGSHVINEGQSL